MEGFSFLDMIEIYFITKKHDLILFYYRLFIIKFLMDLIILIYFKEK